jgi:hypothetical protein
MLPDWDFFSTSEYEEVAFFLMPYVAICGSPEAEPFGRFYLYSIFKSLSIKDRYLEDMNILAPKNTNPDIYLEGLLQF